MQYQRTNPAKMSDEQLPFRQYFTALKRALPSLLLVGLCIATIAYIIVGRSGITYTTHFSYLVSLSEREDTSEYQFDGYYALQATSLFTETLAKVITSPEVVSRSYERAGVSMPSRDPRWLAKSVEAAKTAPQLITVTVRKDSAEEARQLAVSLREEVREYVDAYHNDGIPALVFRVVPSDVWEGESSASAPVVAASIFVFVVLVGANIVMLRESFWHAHRD